MFLQALHPLAVAGVVQNSDFQRDPLGRLFRTANFVGVSTYGSAEEAHACISACIHQCVCEVMKRRKKKGRGAEKARQGDRDG